MSPKVDMERKDLDPEQLANLLRAVHSIYPDHDVTRCNATVVVGEIRFNITVRKKRVR